MKVMVYRGKVEGHNFKVFVDNIKKNQLKKFKNFCKFFLKVTFFAIGSCLVAVFFGSYVYYLKVRSDFLYAKPRINTTQTTFYDKDNNVIYESYGTKEPEWVALKDIPDTVKKATLAAEDLEFYNHDAYDLKGILRAVYENYQKSSETGLKKFAVLFREDSYSQGGSTITQQLVKNRYLTNEKSFDRKIKELIYASELEKRYTKDQILEIYLNEIYYGEQALGIQNAAKIYFNKNAKDLNLAEASMLAGLPQAPTKFSPVSGDYYESKKRQDYVLQRMYFAKFIDYETAKLAANEELAISGKKSFVKKYPFFVDWVMSEIDKEYGDGYTERSGLKVYTSLDQRVQELSEKAVIINLEKFKYRKAGNAAVVVIDPKTNEVRAIVGGKNYEESKVNVATSLRQPGSSFKPVVYMAGLENGYTAATKFTDKYVNFGGNPPYIPRNYDGSYHGTVTMRKALAWSLNIPAVEMLSLLGMDKVIDLGNKLNLDLDEKAKECGLSLALGCKEVRLLDLTNVYSIFDDAGKMGVPTGIKKIIAADGKVIAENKQRKKQVISKENAYIMTNILSDAITRRTIFGYGNKLEIGRLAAAKTGTTDNFTDSWTIGFTPEVVVGVWMGNNDHSPMRETSGIEGAAYIWNEVITGTLLNTPSSDFQKPDGVIEVKVNPYNSLPVKEGSWGIAEFFKEGTIPKDKEDLSYLKRF
ncbi:MAG: PBP1A family penicillin-binding protein [Patescibacteria group bacterium]|nr:PBP1A family penicillin-binding protein [Patescibacteria group bacterium]